jgi:hypothetical protein
MKRLAVVLAAALAAVAIYAVTAPAGQQSDSSRLRALETKVKQLQAFDKRVRRCLLNQAVPVTRYDRYMVQTTEDKPALAKALDVTSQGDAIGFLAVSLRPDCAATLHLRTGAALR